MVSYQVPGVHIEHVLTEPKRILQTGVPVFLGLVPLDAIKAVNKEQSDPDEEFITQDLAANSEVVLVRKRGYLSLPPRPVADRRLGDAGTAMHSDYMVALTAVPPDAKNQQLRKLSGGAAVRPGGAYRNPESTKFSPKPQRFTVWPQFAATYADLEAHGFLTHAVRGFFANGGRLCYVQLIGYEKNMSKAVELGLATLANYEEYDLVCAPDILWPETPDGQDEAMVQTMQRMILRHCEEMGDRIALLDSVPTLQSNQSDEAREAALLSQRSFLSSDFGTLYYPWLRVADGPTQTTGYVPPCGHVAGVIARTDRDIGVHKAPANEEVVGLLALAVNVTDAEQGPLNTAGINCIRAFPRRGIRIWGARTLSIQSTWQYLNVRRVITTAVRWINLNMMDVVFEPHTEALWARIERDLTIYFTKLLEQGALSGRSSQGAFYVKCNAETNPPENREVGQVITEIGLSPVVPAEFIVIRIIHGPTGARIIGP